MDEVELILEARTGGRAAFASLVAQWQGRVFAQALGLLGNRAEAEEAAQEAFARAWMRFDDLRDPAAFPGWIGRIVSRVALDVLRRRRTSPTPEDRPAPVSENPVEAGETSLILWSAVRELTPEYREAFLLVHLEEVSYREAAEQIGVPVSTIEGRVYQAKRILRQKVRTP